jgi:predicted ATPase
MPVLEAFGRLCRESGGQDLLALLDRQAPTWLVQMPWLVSTAELEALQRRILGATRQRMLRELAEAIVVLTTTKPLVLILEDLHWSDYSTLDLLAILAQRQEPARLLLIGTYRPEDVRRSDHPLQTVRQKLQMHGHCQVLPLTFLSEDAIAEYLAARFPGLPRPEQLAHLVHQRSEGNPLFMVNVVESWLIQGMLVEQAGQWVLPAGVELLQAGIPESLRQMIEQQLDRFSAEAQRMVEAGSVAGIDFSAAAVAAGVGKEVVQVEACCADLARRGQLLRASGERAWPDGTVAGCYSFVHALYQEVIYQRVPAAQRVQLHQRLGARMERGYGPQADDIAAELAMHFEQGRQTQRAVTYLQQAADNALRRYGNTEAIQHLTKGLTLLKTLPDTPERTQNELELLLTLGPVLMAAKGYGASEIAHTYTQALQLCQQVGDTPRLFPVLVGLRRFYLLRAELPTARALCERLLSMAQQTQNPALLLEAHWGLGVTLCFLGELASSREHSECGVALYDTQQHHTHAFLYGDDPGVGCLSYTALALWFLGYVDQALQSIRAALTLAQKLSHPFSLAYVLGAAAWLHQYRREPQATYTYAEAKVTLSQARGFPMREAQGTILRGWALAAQGQREEGMTQIRQGLAAFQATGGELNRTYYLALLAETYAQGGQADEGLRVLTEALARVQSGRERWWEAELYRLKGEALLVQAGTQQECAEAEQCLHVALDVAHRQQAKSLELRAAISLGRLWQQQGKHKVAHQLLAEVYHWFTEGFDTADLQEARALLAELSNRPVAPNRVAATTT